jgi:arylsulfatase I/J
VLKNQLTKKSGIWVAAFVAGGALPKARAGVSVVGYVHIVDWFATLLAAAGLPAGASQAETHVGLPPVDSIDCWPLLTGTNTTAPRTEFPLSVPPCEDGSGGGYIRGPWKLLLGKQRSGNAFSGPTYPNASTPVTRSGATKGHDLDCGGGGCLWNIFADPGETSDLAAEFPAVVKELAAALAVANATYYQTPMRFLTHADCGTPGLRRVLESGHWQPFEPAASADAPHSSPLKLDDMESCNTESFPSVRSKTDDENAQDEKAQDEKAPETPRHQKHHSDAKT